MQVKCNTDAILVKGRYVKLARDVSQTPWNLNEDDDGDEEGGAVKVLAPGAHKSLQNVQDLIGGEIKTEIFQAEEVLLHGSGREDVDVRMLGHGRPFILEFINPKKSLSCHQRLDEMRALANKSDKVKALKMGIATKQDFEELKASCATKQKSYVSLVWVKDPVTQEILDEKLNSLKNLTVMQHTPVRVLHRRSQLERVKKVYALQAKLLNGHFFELHVLASAGTYIKEFVHGDLGRTVPNVGQILGTESDILQLDVTNVFEDML